MKLTCSKEIGERLDLELNSKEIGVARSLYIRR